MSKLKLITVWMMLVVTLVLTACSKYEPVTPPDIEMNLRPVERYRAVMTIEDPPTQLRVTGKGSFGIKNTGYCVPVDSRRSLGGSRPQFIKDISLPVTDLPENVYEIIFYADSIKDEDYYGRTICEWSGSPEYRILTPSTTYIVSVDTRNIGTTRTKFCQIRSPRRILSCINEDLMGDADKSGYFSVSTNYYKE